jgi:hypothetical protein
MFTSLITNKSQSVNIYHYYNQLIQLFNFKNILIQQFKCIIQNNVFIIIIHLFFSLSSITKLLKKTKLKTKNLIKTNLPLFFKNIPFTQQLYTKNNFRKLIIKYTVLTLNQKKNRNLNSLCRRIVKQLNKLFKNRKYLIIDFTRLILLLLKGHSVVNLITFYLSKMFSILPKKKHNQFFSTIKKLFAFILLDKTYKICALDCNSSRRISGIKFRFAGRIRGKTRSDVKHISLGVTPLQGDQNKKEYSMRHVFTKFGVFGLKTTLYY